MAIDNAEIVKWLLAIAIAYVIVKNFGGIMTGMSSIFSNLSGLVTLLLL